MQFSDCLHVIQRRVLGAASVLRQPMMRFGVLCAV